MPATAGRVRMPANNRVHSSAALQTHGIWQSTIGYDPYASTKEEKHKSSQKTSSALELEPENAYTNYQGLLALAKITGSNTDEVRGACKKCARVGHLTYQCRNFLSAKDEADKDPHSIHAAVLSGLEKLKGGKEKSKGGNEESSDEDEEEESETSDSDYDSEIEKAIAEKHGKRVTNGKLINNKKSKKRNDDSDDSSDDEDREMRKEKRGRSKKRSSVKRGISDSEDEDGGRRKRRKDERRRRDDDKSSDEEEERRRKSRKEKRRRRSHRYPDEYYSSDDSAGQRHKRRSRRDHLRSDSDVSGSDDPRVGRDKMRSEKKKSHHHHHHHHHRLQKD
ncbi:hypothetical protein OROGR_018374 [Orobanche gracilis]